MNFERLIEHVEENADKGEFSKTDVLFLCYYTKMLLEKFPDIADNIRCSLTYMKDTRYGDPLAKMLEKDMTFLQNVSTNTDLLK